MNVWMETQAGGRFAQRVRIHQRTGREAAAERVRRPARVHRQTVDRDGHPQRAATGLGG